MTLKPLVVPQPVYAGTWAQATAPQVIKLHRTHNEFIADYGARWNAGYRLSALIAHAMGGNVFYSGAWDPSTSGQFLGLARTQDEFLYEYNTWWGKGYRLVALASHVVDGTVYYSGVYNPSKAGQFVGLGRTHDQLLSDYSTWWKKGFRLKALTSERVGGQVRYSGVCDPSTSGQFLGLARIDSDFQSEYATQWRSGYRLAALCAYVENGVVRYSGVWNPSTSGQYLALGYTKPDFLAKHEKHSSEGWRLSALARDHAEALDIGSMGQKLSAALAGNCVGYAATIRAGGTYSRVAGGLRRTSSDPPSRPSSTSARVNVASVAKTITATAVLQLLHARGLKLGTNISGFLPSDWSQGPNIDTITLRELLTHTSGLRNLDEPKLPETYDNLRKMIAKGVNLADKVAFYDNANYCLFRIIIPYLKGGYAPPTKDKATHVSSAFLDYMNTRVFGPAGIGTVALKPSDTEPTLCYPFPAASVKGIHFGDWTDQAGGAGYQLSSDDLAAFLVKLRDGTLLPARPRAAMDRHLLGWQGQEAARHGSVHWHAGGFPLQPGALNTMLMSFTSGVEVGVEVNSSMNGGILDRVIDAYRSSWVTIG
jgi:CubicO group peptidase (beta-lactamase class C family)